MILCHCLLLLPSALSRWYSVFVTYINLITFSGFVFSFGYIYNKAYFLKTETLSCKYLKSNAKTLLAFYISGFFYRLLVYPGRWLTPKEYVDLLVLGDIPGFSEFLISFFLFSMMFFIFYKPIKNYILCNNLLFVFCVLTSLALTFLPYQIFWINQVGLLFGSTRFCAFPVFQYSSFFLIGMYFSKYKVIFNIKIFMISLLATVTFFLYVLIHHDFPGRFPPSIWWILGCWFFIYLYYLFAKFLANGSKLINMLNIIGENTLLYLVISNICIFALKRSGSLEPSKSIIVGILLIAMIYFFVSIIRKPSTQIADKLNKVGQRRKKKS